MAQWKETLEPYVKVIESVKGAALNPVAGEDLVVASVIISDTGSSDPVLITSQSEYIAAFASEGLTEEYMESLNSLYMSDPGSKLASTMWLNGYRLAGSCNMLVCRAAKSSGVMFVKPVIGTDLSDYIIKDSEILRRATSPLYITLDTGSSSFHDGWAVALSDVGIIGNRVDDNGPVYDYYAEDLYDLVETLNETSKFYSPSYRFIDEAGDEVLDPENNAALISEVILDEYYLGTSIIDEEQLTLGLCNLIFKDNSSKLVDLNSAAYSNFTPVEWYVTNMTSSKSDLQVRIRRFNHNAVQQKLLSETDQNAGVSPWNVLSTVLDVYTNEGAKDPAQSILDYDFYEFAVLDPSISENWQVFNVGQISGRGDITMADLNNSLGMMHLTLPANLKSLGLGYYGYTGDSSKPSQYHVSAGIDPTKSSLLNVYDLDIMTACNLLIKPYAI